MLYNNQRDNRVDISKNAYKPYVNIDNKAMIFVDDILAIALEDPPRENIKDHSGFMIVHLRNVKDPLRLSFDSRTRRNKVYKDILSRINIDRTSLDNPEALTTSWNSP